VQRSKSPADYFSAMAVRGRARGVAVLLLVTLGLLAPSFLTPQAVLVGNAAKDFCCWGGSTA